MTKASAAPRVAIYTRISDDADRDGEGVGRQRADCEKRVKREGWRVVKVFEENDTGASRHSKKPRPQYAAMVEMAQRGELDVILAYSNSRLTRRLLDFEKLADLVEKHDIKIKTIVSGDDDLSTADGLMVARIKASVDAAEADRISERVRRGVADKVARGDWLGGPRPFGWQDDCTTLEPVEAKMIRDAAEHLLSGGSVGQVIRDWTESGVTTSRDARWRHVSVNRVMTRWRNCGVMEHHDKPLPDVETPWDPILSIEQVQQLRALLSDPKRGKALGYAPKHLMSGIAVCGKDGCGHVLKSGAIVSRGTRYAMYRCSGPGCGLAIKIEALDDAVIKRMIDTYVTESPGRIKAVQSETRELLAATNKALAEVLAEISEWEDMNDVMSPAKLRAKLTPLREREAELRDEIIRAHRDDAHAAMTAAALSVFDMSDGKLKVGFDYRDKMRGKWDAMELDARRRLIRALITVAVLPAEGRRRDERFVIEPAQDRS